MGMLLEQENKIIGMIYEAALNPSSWQNVLFEIAEYTESTTAIFTATDQLSPDYDFVFTHNISDSCIQIYQDEQVKILDMRLHAPYWQEKVLGDTISSTFAHYAEMPGTDEYIFYEKCAKPTNITHTAAVLLERSAYSWAVFAVHRAPQLAQYTEQEETILKRLGVHLRRALQIYRQMISLDQDKKNIYRALDHFNIGVVLINQDMQLCYSNSIFQKIMEKSLLLKMDKNNKLKTLLKFQDNFDFLIKTALFENEIINYDAGGILALYEEEKNQSLMLSILPFMDQKNKSKKMSIVFVTETNQPQYLARGFLLQKYKLSNREMDVCELFVNGLNFEKISERLSITYGSVRIYIKNIYNKMQCRSQAELMRLLMGITLKFMHI